MTSRYVAGFLAASSLLLGSSASAFAPEFQQDLPTVIITDKLPEAEQTGSGVFDVNGVPSATTEYVVRSSAALDTRPYFSTSGTSDEAGLNDNSFTNIKFRFQEFAYDSETGVGDLQSDGTLLINGEEDFATTPATQADFTSAPLLSGRYDPNDGLLDFRNIDLSGTNEAVNSGFDAIGSVTGQDFSSSPTQQRWVQIYLQGDNELVSTDGLLVISSVAAADQDSLASPAVGSDPFTEEFSTGDFEGWTSAALTYSDVNVFAAEQSGSFDTDGSGYTFDPTFGTAPASTAELGVVGQASTIGFGRWSNLTGIAAAKNTLYRLRADITSNPSSNAAVRLSLGLNNGTDTFTGEGQSWFLNTNGLNAGSGDPAPILGDTAGTEMVTYLVSRDDSSDLQIAADVILLGTSGGQDYTLDAVEVSSADLSELGTGSTILNLGGTPTSTASDAYTSLVANPDDFVEGSGAGEVGSLGTLRVQQDGGGTLPGVTSNYSANNISITWDPDNDASGFGAINLGKPAGGSPASFNDPGAFQAEAGKFYLIDTWLSSSTAASNFPVLDVIAIANGSFQGAGNYTLGSNGGANTNPIDGDSSPFAVGFTPLDAENGRTDFEVELSIRFLSYDLTFPAAANITIDRITVREYEAFLD